MKAGSVAVIIPTYNDLPVLKHAIESVIKQTYRDWELFVVDDGSSNHVATKRYVTSLQNRQIHYLYKTNGGQASARNFGIERSTSEFIAFLDSDDVWYPAKLELQVAKIQGNKALGLVYGFCDYIDGKNQVIGYRADRESGKIYERLLNGNQITGSASMALVRRSVFDEVGLFRNDFLVAEDWEMWLRISYRYSIDFVPETLAALRVGGGSMQKDYNKMADGISSILPKLLNTLLLTSWQRLRLRAYAVGEVVYNYFMADKRQKARAILVKELTRNPFMWRKLLSKNAILYVRILKPRKDGQKGGLAL